MKQKSGFYLASKGKCEACGDGKEWRNGSFMRE
jgi:hypothetical protein